MARDGFAPAIIIFTTMIVHLDPEASRYAESQAYNQIAREALRKPSLDLFWSFHYKIPF